MVRLVLNEDGSRELYFSHECRYGRVNKDLLPLDDDGWQVEQEVPLTVTPSIHCTACGTNGFVREGLWEPA